MRARVGATQLLLGVFQHAFLDALLSLECAEEPGQRDHPVPVAIRAVR